MRESNEAWWLEENLKTNCFVNLNYLIQFVNNNKKIYTSYVKFSQSLDEVDCAIYLSFIRKNDVKKDKACNVENFIQVNFGI